MVIISLLGLWVTPSKWPIHMAYKSGGDPNHLRTRPGMILQVAQVEGSSSDTVQIWNFMVGAWAWGVATLLEALGKSKWCKKQSDLCKSFLDVPGSAGKRLVSGFANPIIPHL